MGKRILAVDASGRTSTPGVWAAGNVVDPRAQVITAAGAGSAAAIAINADPFKTTSNARRKTSSPPASRHSSPRPRAWPVPDQGDIVMSVQTSPDAARSAPSRVMPALMSGLLE